MNSTDQLCNFEAAQNPQPQKKRVRRRRQSRRLYNQIPLNMAEARREIVTALKLHRASTKEAKQQQQRQDQQIKQSLEFSPCFEPQGRLKSMRNPRIYPGCSFYLGNGSDFVAPPLVSQSLYFDDDFKSVDTSSVVCNNSHSLSFLPPSSYICPSVSYAATHQEVPNSISLSEDEAKLMASDLFWSNNVPTGESEKEIQGAVEIDINQSFDKAMEFPDWLSVNDDFLQHGEEDYIQYSDLSCMDIGEIEDVDGDWLA